MRRSPATLLPVLMVVWAAACEAVTSTDPRAVRVTREPLAPSASPKTALATARPSGSPAGTSTPGAIPGWIPPPGTSWQWQLSGPVDVSVDAQVYDIDLFDSDAELVERLHAEGRRVICYLSAGSWEDWRPDRAAFPESVIGEDYAGWPGERWLDIRQIDLLAPIMRARLDLCAARGFDGVEPDNVDGYANNTGFSLTHQDQLTYNIWLANEAHARGLSIGLKNDPDQAAELLPYFDWALTEDCFAEGWCDLFAPFVAAGKAVLAAEYTDRSIDLERICPQAEAMGLEVILKRRELDAWRRSC